MNRLKSLKDIEKEKYRLSLQRELVHYKLKHFARNAKSNWSPERLIENGVGRLVCTFFSRFVQKKSDS